VPPSKSPPAYKILYPGDGKPLNDDHERTFERPGWNPGFEVGNNTHEPLL
jgi:hypothetical protein